MAKLFHRAVMGGAATAALFMLFTAPAAHAQQEALAWARANNCEAIRSYIRQYPSGQYIAQAREAWRSRGCVDPEEQAKKMAEAERRRAENTERENRELRDRVADAERKAADADRRRREAEEKARLAALTSPQDTELARLASIRGDWITSWMNASTGPSTFRGGYYIMGASTKTGGWATSGSYPCGGAIVRGNTWYTPTATSSMKFELVYGRLPTNTTAVVHNFYHSRTSYLGATFQDAWRALSEAGYVKSAQSCGAVMDRRYATPAAADPQAAPTTTTSSATTTELTRLASIRGDWMRGWESTATAPSFFTSGYFILGANGKAATWDTGAGNICGGSIVRGRAWSQPSNTSVNMTFELVYGRMPANSTLTSLGMYAARASYLGTTWNDAWRATSDAAFRASAQTGCGALQDRRSALSTSASPPSATATTPSVVRSLVGEWRLANDKNCNTSPWRFSLDGSGNLVWEETRNGVYVERTRRRPNVLNGNHIEFSPREGNAFEVTGNEFYLVFNGSIGSRTSCRFTRVGSN